MAGIRALAQLLDVAGQMVHQILQSQITITPRVVKDMPEFSGLAWINPLPLTQLAIRRCKADIQMGHRADLVIELPIGKKRPQQKKPRPTYRLLPIKHAQSEQPEIQHKQTHQ